MTHLVKHCVVKGCTGYPSFGMGLPSRAATRWACAAHRKMIEIGAPAAPGEGGQVRVPAALISPSPPKPRQERLL